MEDATRQQHRLVLVFTVGPWTLALPLASVIRAELAVEITDLPGAPPFVQGIMNLAGSVLPVIAMRERLSTKRRSVAISDRIIVVETGIRRIALLVDAVVGLKQLPQDVPDSGSAAVSRPAAGITECVVDGTRTILIYDPEALLSDSEDSELDSVLQHLGTPGVTP